MKRYRRITCLHLSVMFKKDVSPELAMDHMLEMFDNQADRKDRSLQGCTNRRPAGAVKSYEIDCLNSRNWPRSTISYSLLMTKRHAQWR